MRRTLPLLLLLAFVVSPAPARAAELRTSKAQVRKEIIAVVEAQLEAFRAGNVPKAYGYAAAPLRLQTPLRAFTAILQTNYPEIWTNTRAEYGLVRDDSARATVRVHVFAKDSDAAFDYVLLKEPAGWRIGSVLRHVARKREDV